MTRRQFKMLHAGGGGTGSHHIWFTVDEVICGDSATETYVIATVNRYTGGCSGWPGADEYTGQVEIHQTCDTFMRYWTAEQLIGQKGYASWMFGTNEYDQCAAEWIVNWMCDMPECA